MFHTHNVSTHSIKDLPKVFMGVLSRATRATLLPIFFVFLVGAVGIPLFQLVFVLCVLSTLQFLLSPTLLIDSISDAFHSVTKFKTHK